MFGLEPNVLMPHRPPEKHQRLAVEDAAFMRQFIELGGLADVHSSDLIQDVQSPLLSV